MSRSFRLYGRRPTRCCQEPSDEAIPIGLGRGVWDCPVRIRMDFAAHAMTWGLARRRSRSLIALPRAMRWDVAVSPTALE